MEMEPIYQRDRRVKQKSTGRVGTIKSFGGEHPTTGTRFYYVLFEGGDSIRGGGRE
jgi:hypothetical protein